MYSYSTAIVIFTGVLVLYIAALSPHRQPVIDLANTFIMATIGLLKITLVIASNSTPSGWLD